MVKKSTSNMMATGIAALQTVYYDKKMIANLKANTPFVHWSSGCACGSSQTHTVEITYKNKRFKRHKRTRNLRLCDGCFFRYQVMKAANRVDEFVRAYDKQRKTTEEPNARNQYGEYRPLPAGSGKTFKMFDYKPVIKP